MGGKEGVGPLGVHGQDGCRLICIRLDFNGRLVGRGAGNGLLPDDLFCGPSGHHGYFAATGVFQSVDALGISFGYGEDHVFLHKIDEVNRCFTVDKIPYGPHGKLVATGLDPQ